MFGCLFVCLYSIWFDLVYGVLAVVLICFTMRGGVALLWCVYVVELCVWLFGCCVWMCFVLCCSGLCCVACLCCLVLR